MIKGLKVVYFHIYNSYYKDGNYSNDIPHLTAFGIVGCSLGFMLTTLAASVVKFLDGEKLATTGIYPIMIVGLTITFFMFMYKSKYRKVYYDIKGSAYDRLPFKIAAWITVLAGFISFMICAFIL
ncbi:hypothetical protein [Nafulsella turpanensis]|uniref:hypothetical protein n=1 Tax=Nafulsella turpanensis TaxID=1265690 RepID=UPI0003748E42|nr:hypothetical protein [Nafulsella turpanensis]